jgi:serine phosphatase RsbU (regulator of sigma subunit)
VTNGVIHARTDIELEIVADPDGVEVSVTDFAAAQPTVVISEVTVPAGSAGPDASPADRAYAQVADAAPAEGGRGLLLVSQFAARWGTTHENGGRRVWFRLDASDGRTGPADAPEPAAPVPTIDAAIAAVVEARAGNVQSPSALADLLTRLCAGLGATTATIVVNRADGAGDTVVARYVSDREPAPDGRTVRVPLGLSRPWTGELTMTGARGKHAEALATLTAGQFALILENKRLHEAHDDRRGWLLFLAEAGELLVQSMNVDLTVALIPRLVVPRLGPWCAVHLIDEYGEMALASVAHESESSVPELTARLEGARMLLRAVDTTTPLGGLDGMAFPLFVRSERVGTLAVGRPGAGAHTADDLAIIEDLSRRAAVAIENARIHETRSQIATALQQSLLPPELPEIQGLDVAAQYVPAGSGVEVGGDFYDLVPMPEQHGWMVVVGDVSGKGIRAAAVTGLVRDVLHTLAREHREAEHALGRLNATLVERGGGYFCTLALAFLRTVRPGVVDLSLHLAGHEQPVLVRADGTASLVGECGTALGLLDKIRAPRANVQLTSGDSLVFYTDGVTERRRGTTLYGQRRLREEVANLAGSPASALAARLRSSVLAFSTQPPRDDIAIVALRAL